MSSSSSSSLASRRVGAHSASSGHLPSVEHTHGGSSSGSSTGSSSKDEAEGNFSHGGGRSHIVIPSSTSSASLLLLSSGPGASSGGSSGSMVGGSSSAFSLKWMALIVLVLQNSSLILFMRASRVGSDADSVYLISTAVAVAEATKLVLASALMFLLDCNANVSTFVSVLRYELFVNWREFMKMCVPSGLYVVQNNLQYLGASHLPAAVFQVLVQMKIITTALFSVTMLSRKLSGMQWLAVVSLGLGIGLVQISQQQSSSSSSREEEEEGQEVSGFAPGLVVSSSMVGIVAVLVSCLTSGFAGVYFEKVLKTNSTSIWMRNIQLAIIGIVISLVSSRDLQQILYNNYPCIYRINRSLNHCLPLLLSLLPHLRPRWCWGATWRPCGGTASCAATRPWYGPWSCCRRGEDW